MNALEFRFAFYARDFEKSVSFYRDMLGMKYIGGWDRPDDKGALLSAGGTGVVEIFGEPAGKTYKGPNPTAVNLALRLEDISAVDHFYEDLLQKGAEHVRAPKGSSWGHYALRIDDPDDIPIYVYCEVAEPLT
ncbi:MAG TPA: VOC family protein [Anaerolineales bacterium]|nr:VOC family protein [Anaerolineales bacterium]